MYIPPAFAESRPEVLRAFMSQHPFAMVVTHAPDRGMMATHLPTVLDPEHGQHGALTFHVARANPHAACIADAESLVIFTGPHAYISPTWYQKPEAAVPTWNYTAVHAYGTARPLDAVATRTHLVRLTAQYESSRREPWTPGRLSPELLSKLETAIVAFELPIVRIEGKWKLGQNRTAADRAGVARHLAESPYPDDRAVAELMATLSS